MNQKNGTVISAFVIDGNIIESKCIGEDTITVNSLNVANLKADLCLFPHAKYAVETGAWRTVFLSNDTPVIVGCISHIDGLKTLGLQELWFRGGTGDWTRYIPYHVIATGMGSSLYEILPVMHCLTLFRQGFWKLSKAGGEGNIWSPHCIFGLDNAIDLKNGMDVFYDK